MRALGFMFSLVMAGSALADGVVAEGYSSEAVGQPARLSPRAFSAPDLEVACRDATEPARINVRPAPRPASGAGSPAVPRLVIEVYDAAGQFMPGLRVVVSERDDGEGRVSLLVRWVCAGEHPSQVEIELP